VAKNGQKGEKIHSFDCYGNNCGKKFVDRAALMEHKNVSPQCKNVANRGSRFREERGPFAPVHNYNAGCVVNVSAPSVQQASLPVASVAAPPAAAMPAVPNADAPVARVEVPRVQAEDDLVGIVPKHAPKLVVCDDNKQSRLLFRQKCMQFAIVCTCIAGLLAMWIPAAILASNDALQPQVNATFSMYDFQPDFELTGTMPVLSSVFESVQGFFWSFAPTNPVNQQHVHALGVGQSSVELSRMPFVGFCVMLIFPTILLVGLMLIHLRSKDYIRYTLIGCAYTEACWKGDVRSLTMKTIPKSSPDFVPDAKYLVYRVSECRYGVQQQTKDVVISYSLYLAMSADVHTKKYTTLEKCSTLLSDSFGFAAQCKQINIAEELNADHDVTMNTCRFFAARLLSNRFGGGDLNCMRL
jgi:hypothetical protein